MELRRSSIVSSSTLMRTAHGTANRTPFFGAEAAFDANSALIERGERWRVEMEINGNKWCVPRQKIKRRSLAIRKCGDGIE